MSTTRTLNLLLVLACGLIFWNGPAAARADLVAQWIADNYTSGDWVDSAAGTPIHATIDAGTPTAVANQLNGHQVVRFSGSDSFQVASGDSPMSGANDFTIVAVFSTSTAGAGGAGQWYQNTGLVDMEQGGVQNDWGLVLNGSGQVGAGLGNPDKTAYSSATGLADGTAHIAVYTRSGDTITVYTDVAPAVTVTGASTNARNTNRFTIGKMQTNINYYTGDLAEVQIYNEALSSADVVALVGSLASTYTALPTPTAVWRADDLAETAGTAVATWTDSIGGVAASQATSSRQPTIVTDFGSGGHKALHFDGVDDQLRVLAASNPMAGALDFTIAVVFESDQGITDGSNWYHHAGIVDAEQPGVTADWGLSLSADGTLTAGLGSPDLTLSSASGLNDDGLHVAVYRRDATTGELFLTVDGVTTLLSGGATTARNAADMVFGSIQTNLRYFEGDLGEVQIYNTFLSDIQVAALNDTLQSYYIPEPSTCALLFSGLAGLGIFWRRRRSAT